MTLDDWLSEDAKTLARYLYERSQEDVGLDHDTFGILVSDIIDILKWDDKRYKQAAQELTDEGFLRHARVFTGTENVLLTTEGRQIVRREFKSSRTIGDTSINQNVSYAENVQMAGIQNVGSTYNLTLIINQPSPEPPMPYESDRAKSGWSKAGNVFWLCFDLLDAWNNLLNGSPKEMIDRALGQSCHHADEIGLNEAVRTKICQLRDTTQAYRETDWTPQKREQTAHEVKVMFNEVAQLAQKSDPGFKAHPDNRDTYVSNT